MYIVCIRTFYELKDPTAVLNPMIHTYMYTYKVLTKELKSGATPLHFLAFSFDVVV